MEEIDLATFVPSLLIVPFLKPRAVVPSDPTAKVTTTAEATSTPRAAVVGKGKGIYVPPPKKIELVRPKGIVIRASPLLCLRSKKRKTSPSWGFRLDSSSGIKRRRVVGLTIKASIDTV